MGNNLDSLRLKKVMSESVKMWRHFAALHPKRLRNSSVRNTDLTDLRATKPRKPTFWRHAHTLPPKQCLSLSSLTVVYSRQHFDSLISRCLTGPPPRIRHRSETLNLAPLCLWTPLSPTALYTTTEFAALHAGSPDQLPEQMVICTRWEKKMKELHLTKVQTKSRRESG